MKLCALLVAAGSAFAQPLAGTRALDYSGDPVQSMIDGITRYLERATESRPRAGKPDRERLRHILGVVDPRVKFTAPELVGTVERPALLVSSKHLRVTAVRWPVLDGVTAEGLLLEPVLSQPRARVIAIPDADQLPENFAVAQRLAAAGAQVLVPVLIDRTDTWSGNPRIRMTNQPHREFIYRMAYPQGRHIIGFEVQKVLAALDWFEAQRAKLPVGVWGYGEGGLIASYAAALDPRINATVLSGYRPADTDLWKQPIYRNVWSVLRDFQASGSLLYDSTPGPRIDGPPPVTAARRGGAPGALASERSGDSDAFPAFAHALGLQAVSAPPVEKIPEADSRARQKRQLDELIGFTQRLVPHTEAIRAQHTELETLRRRFAADIIGVLATGAVPLNARTRQSYRGKGWTGYEVMLDVRPDVFAYGVLLIPDSLKHGERRPLVVAQHGVNGRPQDLFAQRDTRAQAVYQNIGERLIDEGFAVYLPQNLYVGEFRHLSRLANPLGLTIYSFMTEQHRVTLDWLASLPFIDAERIGFYGLSYGGKTALRVPPFEPRYKAVICSGDFNEWIHKLVTYDRPYSYIFTHEYEILEWDLASVANHAEMAKLIFPRPFMVERGHRDTVGIDEWVSYEYAKVRRFYTQQGLGDRTSIAYFDGPHQIHGDEAIEFLKRWLR